MERNNWTEEEVTLALAVYFQTPYGRISGRNKLLQAMALKIGRTPGAVSLKLGNLARLDTRVLEAGKKGFSNGSKTDKLVWNSYVDNKGNIALESLTDRVLEICAEKDITAQGILIPSETNQETERLVTCKERCHQAMFRSVVISRYSNRCAVTGLGINELLEAAHIVPWSEDQSIRLEPSNGLALNPLIHAAYDSHLLGIDADGLVHISERLMDNAGDDCMRIFIRSLEKKQLHFPDVGRPAPDLLDRHFQQYLRAN